MKPLIMHHNAHMCSLIDTNLLQAGKGRTGLMVCAYLVYCGMSAEEALQLYAQQRTTNNEGVSHIRYNIQTISKHNFIPGL